MSGAADPRAYDEGVLSPVRLRTVLLAVVAVLAALLVTPAPAAQAADDKGIVNGSISCPKLNKCPGLTLLWFDSDWNYVGEKKLGKGARGYSVNLPADTYRLQLIDQRPSYDVSKYAPTDVKVTVKANRLSERNITMKKGGAITGTTLNGKGKRLRGAKVVAANQGQQSYSTQANKKGQFAIGGLPEGKYSVFTYDKAKTWVGRSTWAGAVKPGQAKNLRVKLTKRAGDLTVYLTTPNGLLRTKTTLTVTSRQSGQWWSKTSSNGTFAFRGLHPGGYTAVFNGAGVWFARSGSVSKADVRSNRFDTGEFHVTKRGGWITGHILDGGAPEMIALTPPWPGGPGATIRLYDADDNQLATTTSDDEGRFKLQGQLATQAGLTIVVDPPSNSGGYMNGEGYCRYDHIEFPDDYAVHIGEESYIGPLPIPRYPGQNNPACASD